MSTQIDLATLAINLGLNNQQAVNDQLNSMLDRVDRLRDAFNEMNNKAGDFAKISKRMADAAIEAQNINAAIAVQNQSLNQMVERNGKLRDLEVRIFQTLKETAAIRKGEEAVLVRMQQIYIRAQGMRDREKLDEKLLLESEQRKEAIETRRLELAKRMALLKSGFFDKQNAAESKLAKDEAAYKVDEERGKKLVEIESRREEIARRLKILREGGYDKQMSAEKALAADEAKLKKEWDSRSGKTGQERLQAVGSAVHKTLERATLAASASLFGFAMTGIRASALGTLMNWQFERLSRAIGGLLAPTIIRVTELIGSMASGIERMTGGQKETLSNMLQGAVAFKATSFALGSIFGPVGAAIGGIIAALTVADMGFDGLINAIEPLFGVFAELLGIISEALQPVIEMVARVMKQLVPIIGDGLRIFGDVVIACEPLIQMFAAVVEEGLKPFMEVIKWVIDTTKSIGSNWKDWARSTVKYMTFGASEAAIGETHTTWAQRAQWDKEEKEKRTSKKDMSPLLAKAGGPEAVEATWMRIAQSSRLVGTGANKPVAERQLDEQEKQRKEQEKSNEILEKLNNKMPWLKD